MSDPQPTSTPAIGLACPFCASGAALKMMTMPATSSERETFKRLISAAVMCSICKTIGPRKGSPTAALQAWNTRKKP